MNGFSEYGQAPEESSRWRPALIGVVVIAIIAGIFWFLGRSSAPPPAVRVAPAYAANLQIGNLHLSTAHNFVGGQVTYLQGKIANLGQSTVNVAEVEAVFRNSLGEVVDRQTQPLRVAASALGNPDWVTLRLAPLRPNQTAAFRLTFDHVSADWNNGFPELRLVDVTTQ